MSQRDLNENAKPTSPSQPNEDLTVFYAKDSDFAILESRMEIDSTERVLDSSDSDSQLQTIQQAAPEHPLIEKMSFSAQTSSR